jgi:hypothetical protein
MRHKAPGRTGRKEPAFGSRREFLGYGSAIVGASILGPLYPRLASAQSAGFDFYISPTGSDSNPGTLASPWAITAINTKQSAYAGRRVGLLDGTYACSSLMGNSGFYSPALNIAAGSSSAPTVIQSVNPRSALLNGGGSKSSNPNSGAIIGSNQAAGYITIDGLTITNNYGAAVVIGPSGPTSDTANSSKMPGVIVQNCEISNVTLAGGPTGSNVPALVCGDLLAPLISNNKIHDVAANNGDEHNVCGMQLWGCANAVIQFNTIYNAVNSIYIKNLGNRNNSVRFNFCQRGTTSPGQSGDAIQVDDIGAAGTDTYFNNNVLYSDAPGAAPCGPDFQPAFACRTHFYNNTMYVNATQGTCQIFTYGPLLSYFNNIFFRVGTTSYRGDVNFNQGGLALIDYNCYFNSGFSCGLSTPGTQNGPTLYASLTAWAAATGGESHSITANPMFAGTGAYAAAMQLSGASPCIGAGRSDGTPGGSPCDMGAWGNGATQVGCNFAAGAPPVVTPDPPKIISVT